jgi:hypothetical protein
MKISEDAKRTAKRSAAIGFVLAIICQLVPPDYRAVCDLIASVCRGGI